MPSSDHVSTDPLEPVGEGSHVVRRGECISSIAEKHGFFWQTLWDAPENRTLRETRGDPNVLLPGDRVSVPEIRQKEQPNCHTGLLHRFKRRGIPERLRMRFVHADEGPKANMGYLFDEGGNGRRGETDGDGYLEEWISTRLRVVTITFDDGAVAVLQVGDLDPPQTVRGAGARLMSLGFASPGANLAVVLETFQLANGIEPTSQLDEPTIAALVEAFGR
ncbi:MAG: LysM peptidoglycan-binding domain-containing protein [Nannocystales bacterium]